MFACKTTAQVQRKANMLISPHVLSLLRHIIVQPRRELAKHMLTVLMLFLTGLLPWVDNWAHLFGFIFGLLITIGR